MPEFLRRTFPTRFDNHFPGRPIAFYAFVLIAVVTTMRSLIHLAAPDGGAQSIATIPLASYSTGAAGTVIGIFSLWGLSQTIIAALYWLAILRYRALIPLFYLLLVVEYAGRMAIGHARVVETVSTAPGSVINLPLVVVCSALYALSVSGAQATPPD